MKQHFVKTRNHQHLMAHIKAVENRGSPEACILLLTGEPGTGKSCNIDNWGSEVDAVYLEGIPGMSLAFVRDYLADQTGIHEKGKFAQYKSMVNHLKERNSPIILDEAQHGLPDKAECIEYLRRIAEQAGVILVLVCHTSERNRFSVDKLAHIATRITAAPELKPANVDDIALYLAELCEVTADRAIAEAIHAQSGGRYRLLANAVKTLEAIAGKLGKTALTGADIGKVKLCEDAMKTFARGGK